jgi:hypothetical protein
MGSVGNAFEQAFFRGKKFEEPDGAHQLRFPIVECSMSRRQANSSLEST